LDLRHLLLDVRVIVSAREDEGDRLGREVAATDAPLVVQRESGGRVWTGRRRGDDRHQRATTTIPAPRRSGSSSSPIHRREAVGSRSSA
jgi:hypothetical protein